MGPGFDSNDYRDAYPGYRFRGDPPAGRAGWQSGPRDAAWRFRPLDDQELGRMDRGPSYRPIDRRGEESRRAPAATPGEAYGFEPAPWRSR